MRRLSAAVAICGALVVLAAVGTGVAAPTAPAGPRLAVGAYGGSVPPPHLVTIGPAGEDPRLVARAGETGPEYLNPVWNAAATELAFIGPGRKAALIQLIDADGSNVRPLTSSERLGRSGDGWIVGEPVFDPATGGVIVAVVHTENIPFLFNEDHRGLEATGPVRSEFWELPVDGSAARLLSSRVSGRKRAMVPLPGTIAADGTVAATSYTKRGYGVITIDPWSGASHVVVPSTVEWQGSLDPAISPDGSQIAYKVDVPKIGPRGTPVGTVGSDLMIVPTAGGKPRRLTRIKGLARWPTWDPSGSRIAFTALNLSSRVISTTGGGGEGSSLMEINPDGSCLTKVYTVPGGAVGGAAWQPGADRGAPPIAC